jgi:hypothetical protein
MEHLIPIAIGILCLLGGLYALGLIISGIIFDNKLEAEDPFDDLDNLGDDCHCNHCMNVGEHNGK